MIRRRSFGVAVLARSGKGPMAHITTQFDIGDFVKPRHGARRGFSFCVGQIRILGQGNRAWLIQYRPVFSSGTPGSWTDEAKLSLIRRAVVHGAVPSVRDMRNTQGAE